MVLAYKFRGKRYDCGSLDGYVKTIIELYNGSNSQSADIHKFAVDYNT